MSNIIVRDTYISDGIVYKPTGENRCPRQGEPYIGEYGDGYQQVIICRGLSWFSKNILRAIGNVPKEEVK